jgi:hypothetical protein
MVRFAGVVAIALALALLAVPGSLQAQRRGGAAVGGGMAHGGVAVAPRANNAFTGTRPSPVLPPVVSPVIRPPGRSFVPGAGGRSGALGVRHRNVVVGPAFGYGYGLGYGLGYPYYSQYYPGYADPFYSAPQNYSEPQYVPPAAPDTSSPSQSELELSYQVGQLSQQIEQLRQQQALAQAPPRPVAPEPVPMPTVLVFRDGHRIEITNYAIIGQTLWVLDERNSTKIPVSDLDVDATQKENRIRGLRFQVH